MNEPQSPPSNNSSVSLLNLACGLGFLLPYPTINTPGWALPEPLNFVVLAALTSLLGVRVFNLSKWLPGALCPLVEVMEVTCVPTRTPEVIPLTGFAALNLWMTDRIATLKHNLRVPISMLMFRVPEGVLLKWRRAA